MHSLEELTIEFTGGCSRACRRSDLDRFWQHGQSVFAAGGGGGAVRKCARASSRRKRARGQLRPYEATLVVSTPSGACRPARRRPLSLGTSRLPAERRRPALLARASTSAPTLFWDSPPSPSPTTHQQIDRPGRSWSPHYVFVIRRPLGPGAPPPPAAAAPRVPA
jgi:hypothetical protein